MEQITIIWTGYFLYRSRLRSFDLATVEQIVRYSSERYVDAATGRIVAVGRHEERLVMIPYEREGNTLTPVTIHATSRRQINLRIKSTFQNLQMRAIIVYNSALWQNNY